MPGLPPGLGTFEWLAAASTRMPGASAAALIVTWTALIFSLWVGVFSALASVLVVLFGVGVSGHALGVLSYTSHTGTSLDLLAVLGSLEIVLQKVGHKVELGSGVRAAQNVYLRHSS